MKPDVLDCSHYQGVIDFQKVRDAGIQGIIAKATEGTKTTDDTYMRNIAGARAARLLVGTYHFMRPGNVLAQVDHFFSVARPDNTMLVALDWEDPAITLVQVQQFLAYADGKLGRPLWVYSGQALLQTMLGKAQFDWLRDRPLWIARYPKNPDVTKPQVPPTFPRGATLWQYSDKGKVPGIAGNVDCNIYLGSAGLARDWAPVAAAIPPKPAPKLPPDIPPIPVPMPPNEKPVAAGARNWVIGAVVLAALGAIAHYVFNLF